MVLIDFLARLCTKSVFATLIHTWLQPGDDMIASGWKPFKRFLRWICNRGTWLKPGVNETEHSRFVKLKSLCKASLKPKFRMKSCYLADNQIDSRPWLRCLHRFGKDDAQGAFFSAR